MSDAVNRTYAAAQKVLEEAAIQEEYGDLSPIQLLARSNAAMQQQVCSLFEALKVMGERVDILEDKLDRYRRAEL